MDIVSIVNLICGAGGVLGLTSYVLFFREKKRLKVAEAKKLEVEVESSEIVSLADQLKKCWDRIETQDQKIEKVYEELRLEQEEKLNLIKSLNNKDLEIKLLSFMKCEVRGCEKREPPSEY